ncbi:MAG: hypothetical protein ILO68_07440, partial [Clostridia bacterium]|nr:hypothetical protein [Clostridia bacterium]
MDKLGKYDVNMAPSLVQDGLSYFDPLVCGTFTLEGLPWAKEWGKYYRLPKDCKEHVSDGVYWLMKMPAGGMIRFRTDSRKVSLKIRNAEDYLMFHMTPVGQQGADLYFR